MDLKHMCCAGPSAQSTIQGIDKTFNLGDLHVTVTVFKNISVTTKQTNDHPLTMGPAFLHGNLDTKTYSMFFQYLTLQLGPQKQHLVVGSDKAKALRAAITRAFLDAKRMVCMRHLKNNVIDYLKDKVGLDSHRKKKDITDKTFWTGWTSRLPYQIDI